jgi:hypothetical protein
MQIHTHKLPSRVAFHQGASFVVKREQPQHPPGTHEERRPRSFIASGPSFLAWGFFIRGRVAYDVIAVAALLALLITER